MVARTGTPNGKVGKSRCEGCSSPHRKERDAALISHTQTLAELVSRFGGSTSALSRHRRHVAGAIVRATARTVAPPPDSREIEAYEDTLLSKVSRLETDARRLGARAEAEGDLRAALVAVDKLLDVAKLLHELAAGTEAEPAVLVSFTFPPSGLGGALRTTNDANEYMPVDDVPARGDVEPVVAYPSPPPTDRRSQ